MEWLQANWTTLGEAIAAVILAAGAIVGFFDGPKADRTRGALDGVLGMLRMIGIGTYKDEPGMLSVPLKTDTGERIVTTENVK